MNWRNNYDPNKLSSAIHGLNEVIMKYMSNENNISECNS